MQQQEGELWRFQRRELRRAASHRGLWARRGRAAQWPDVVRKNRALAWAKGPLLCSHPSWHLGSPAGSVLHGAALEGSEVLRSAAS